MCKAKERLLGEGQSISGADIERGCSQNEIDMERIGDKKELKKRGTWTK